MGGAITMAESKQNKRKSSGAEHLDKLREILFGSEHRRQEKRANTLERRLAKDSDALRGDLEKRVKALEQQTETRLQQVHAMILEEREARRRSDVALGKRITTLSRAVDKKLTPLRQRLQQGQVTLRDEMLAETAAWGEELKEDLEALRAAVLERSTLASLVGELAQKLGPTTPR